MPIDCNRIDEMSLGQIAGELCELVGAMKTSAKRLSESVNVHDRIHGDFLQRDLSTVRKLANRINAIETQQRSKGRGDGVPLSSVHGSHLNGLGCRVPGCGCGGMVVPTRELASQFSGD